MEITQGMCGLPQACIIAKQLIAQRLGNDGYYQGKHTPVLWRDVWIPISLILVVKYFGVGYVGREHVDCLTSAYKIYYEKLQQIGKERYTVE